MRREIGALRKIHHPNVVEVFWADKTSVGEWYLITEFIDGESLDEFVTGSRRLRDREAVDVALDLLDALVAFILIRRASGSWMLNVAKTACRKPSRASG